MLFNSWSYLLFLALALGAYRACRDTQGRIRLIAALSMLFYGMWRWDFLLLIVFSASIDYIAAQKIAATQYQSVRKKWLITSLAINVGLLVFFKYAYFIDANIAAVGTWAGWTTPRLAHLGLDIVLPLGISFYTFQTVSYTIDVYRGILPPQRRFVVFLAYVMFWPQLIAGPILRAGEVIPQLQAQRDFCWQDLGHGAKRIVQGLFQKVVLADTLATSVNSIYAKDIATLNALDVWTAAFLFGFQIYFDFSGYSAIAIGSARLLGIRFPENFNWPYWAKSPKDFWGRWHISLGAWIRDYVYLPLAGEKFQTRSLGGLQASRMDRGRADRALWLTWLLMGFWHGAGWNFALWGMYHGFWVWMFRRVRLLRELPQRLGWLCVGLMLLISMAGWIPFRAASVPDAWTMFQTLLNPFEYRFVGHRVTIYDYALALCTTIGTMAAYPLGCWFKTLKSDGAQMLMRIAGYAVMGCAIILCMGRVQQFIYFQF